MGFYIDTSEIRGALKQYQEQARQAENKLTDGEKVLKKIVNSQALQGKVGQAISLDLSNHKYAVLVGLKNCYKLLAAEFQKTYQEFQETTGETAGNAIIAESTVQKAQTDIDQFATEYQERRQKIVTVYSSISDLMVFSSPSSQSFNQACATAKKQLQKISQKVTEFDQQQSATVTDDLLQALIKQLKRADSVKELAYTDAKFMEFVSQVELVKVVTTIERQLAEIEQQAELAAAEALEAKQLEWGKHHPLENTIQNVSASIGNWWQNVITGTQNSSRPKLEKKLLLSLEGMLGKAAQGVSSIAFGVASVAHLGVELGEWSIDSIRGVETPQWKIDDLKGAGKTIQTAGKVAGAFGIEAASGNNPWITPWVDSLIPERQQIVKETTESLKQEVAETIADVKAGDAYAIGGHLFDVGSLFVGIGGATGIAKGAQLATKGTARMTAFKATTLGRIGQVSTKLNQGMMYGDDAVKAVGARLNKIPLTVADDLMLTNGAKVKVSGTLSVDDYNKIAKSNFTKGSARVGEGVEKVSGLTKAQKVEDFQNRVDNIRNQMPNSKLKNQGNMAVADVKIKDLPDEFMAHSKIHGLNSKGVDLGDFSPASENRIFESYTIDKFPRYNDTEVKILEDIASKIKDPNISGKIDLFTELPACQSCTNVILEFRKKFPNIELNIFTK